MTDSISKEFKPTFENGGFWEYYKDLERQFEDFLEFVPYFQKNTDTFSFRLANLLVAIGGYVDSAFKEIAVYPTFLEKFLSIIKNEKGETRNPTIKDYLFLAEEYSLNSKEVEFKCLPEREIVVPFAQYERIGKEVVTPDWWQIYNGVKHHFRDNLEKANLKNARDALAGAFLLNVVHIPSAIRLYDYGVMKIRIPKEDSPGRFTKVGSARSMVMESLEKRESFFGDIETTIFSYDYSQ